jgi:hypothetical protein
MDSPEQLFFILCQGFFAGSAFASDFNSLLFVVFSIFWPIFRFHNKQQSFLNAGIIFVILFFTEWFHLIYAPKFLPEFENLGPDLGPHLSHRHHIMAITRLFAHLVTWIRATFANLSFQRIIRRLLLFEKWTVLWAKQERYAVTFTNRLFSVPAAIVAYSDITAGKFNAQSVLCLLLVVGMVMTGIGYEESGCCDVYLVMVVALVAVPLAIERRVSRKIRGTALTIGMCLSVLMFIDWAPLIYAYNDPAPFIRPRIPSFQS